MRIEKTTILPIISLVALVIQAIFHKEISIDLQNQIAEIAVNIFFVGFTLYGIFKNHGSQLPENQKENGSESIPSQNSDNSTTTLQQ